MELTIDQALRQAVDLHKAGQVQEADRLYTAILKAQPNHPDANHNLGVLAVSVGKVTEAVPLLKTALEANPGVTQFWLSYINALITLDKLAEAKAVLDQAKSQGVQGESFDELGKRLKSLAGGSKDSASKVEDPPQDQVQSLITLYNRGQLQKALKQVDFLIQQFPQSALLFNIHGAVLLALGQLDLSVEAYKKALAIKPDYAEAYYNMGISLKEQVQLEEAIAAFKKALAIRPDYAVASHMLASLSGKKTKSAPRQYVEELFDGYAAKFEKSLVLDLEYQIPKILTQLALQNHDDGSLGSVLDLGCGTGLAGVEIREFCSNLVGVDVSKKMLEVAKTKNIYDQLSHAEILDYLSNSELNFDYFIATDVFVYIGDLSDVFQLIKEKNKKTGKFIFSTEDAENEGFHLEMSGRYSHSYSYIEGLCEKFKFSISHFSRVDLRKEKGVFLTGGVYLLDF